MSALRVSASDIDALRYFMADEDGDLPALLARLRRQEPPTESMLAGTALHKALENSQNGSLNEIESDGFCFAFDFDGELELPAIREMKATSDYQIGDTTVTLVGKVDAIHGRRVDDHKFTSRYDGERFLGGFQWRVYLELFDADEFRWNVFEGREKEPRRYTIFNFHRLTTHRYPGMSDDIRRELAAYVSFASAHLPERFT